jgi:hypothetical protein
VLQAGFPLSPFGGGLRTFFNRHVGLEVKPWAFGSSVTSVMQF